MTWKCSMCSQPLPSPPKGELITCGRCGTQGAVPTEGLDSAKCPHMNFNVHAKIARIQKSEQEPEVIVAYSMDVSVFCRECGQPFEFFGLPNGFSHYRPTVSIDGQELRAPIILPGTRPPGASLTQRVPAGTYTNSADLTVTVNPDLKTKER